MSAAIDYPTTLLKGPQDFVEATCPEGHRMPGTVDRRDSDSASRQALPHGKVRVSLGNGEPADDPCTDDQQVIRDHQAGKGPGGVTSSRS